MALSKVTYVDGTTVIGADNLNDIQDEVIAAEKNAFAYARCSTAADTMTKTAYGINELTPEAGQMYLVEFTYGNTVEDITLRLSVNSTVYSFTVTGMPTDLSAGAIVLLKLDSGSATYIATIAQVYADGDSVSY